jgi:N-carbamoylputrescine amidase
MANARSYGQKGVELVAVPRATGDRSVEKWVAGGKVAAVLAGAYCVSSNRRGKRGEATFGGRGWVIDPDGEVLGLTSRARPFVTVEIDRATANRAKTTYPRDSLGPD